MLKVDEVEKFIENVKIESSYRKCITDEAIQFMIKNYPKNYKKIAYKKTIDKPLNIAINFYKEYNIEYYELIKKGLQEKNILIIDNSKLKSKLDIETKKSTIYLKNNDEDIFIIIHELAHYIDVMLKILPEGYGFLCEVISFYMEKVFSNESSVKYKDVIKIRNNNRIFNEIQMLEAIKYEYYYENLYKQKHYICNDDIELESVRKILRFGKENIINYCLRYPIGDISSYYLINRDIKLSSKVCDELMNVDFIYIMKLFFDSFNNAK